MLWVSSNLSENWTIAHLEGPAMCGADYGQFLFHTFQRVSSKYNTHNTPKQTEKLETWKKQSKTIQNISFYTDRQTLDLSLCGTVEPASPKAERPPRDLFQWKKPPTTQTGWWLGGCPSLISKQWFPWLNPCQNSTYVLLRHKNSINASTLMRPGSNHRQARHPLGARLW